ncbi:hypothetical protein Pen02_08790 [Plantactinospora endophytica]|uniref:Uncharacterized protein n=1 Tax=Plantactinospora endophytica TaxID=673535 RepID=A0ABQ4DU20_9ACTN|nr:hypothetical protein Pen02_08790 [Plantactinospora endophytica]
MPEALCGGYLRRAVGDQQGVSAGPGLCRGGEQNGHGLCVGPRAALDVSADGRWRVDPVNGMWYGPARSGRSAATSPAYASELVNFAPPPEAARGSCCRRTGSCPGMTTG